MALLWIVIIVPVLYFSWKYWTWTLGAGYDPTPPEKALQLLALAGLKENDVLYDLGCGDGRLLVLAARKYGAHAVGIEADPLRWLMALRNVRKAGLQDLVTVRLGNFFKRSVAEATVVSLYLYPPVNRKLKGKFTNELRKGTRIVSYSWAIEGWEDEGTRSGDGLYLYIIR
jgi:tRNA A58 N-methylase Trm61